MSFRHVMPFLVGIAAVVTGLLVARVRVEAGVVPAVRRPVLVVGVAIAMVLVGVVLLALGWWVWGAAPPGADPAMVASVAYVGASVELFFAAMLLPTASRAARSSNPSWRARRR